ncbi:MULTISPECIES: tetratricopeptide repeat protein [unclassified Psychrobacter]|uniref:tetratricopeptide repeat protein n=1 Tax=unclassified Psychrobacter TaxID=196806 RepID=UPI0012EC8773|nr:MULTISPECIES: tetratricopeptide repeat protein [unclassified Psychrobacter]
MRLVYQVYLYGFFSIAHYAKAGKWYLKAANQGDARSQYNLGMMYLNGIGVRRNTVIAKKYFSKACDNGYQLGCNNLGIRTEDE